MTNVPTLKVRGVSKQFGAVRALHDIGVDVAEGSVHALVGENGAGKSTLGKILSGVLRPDTGSVHVRGREVSYHSPKDALDDGITTISQEIAVLTKQTVLQNVFLGRESTRYGLLDPRQMRRSFDELVALTDFDIDPNAIAGRLRLADQKKVEVLQAVARESSIIIMDEPTAMLPDDETRTFLEIVRKLQSLGRTIVYISHFLEEVLEIADDVTVMRNGEVIRTSPTRDETPHSLVEGMLGKSMTEMYPPKVHPKPDAPVVFSVQDLHTDIFRGLNFEVRAGEIVGLAGLVGSGRSRLVRTLFGAERIDSGSIRIQDRPVSIRSTADAIDAGIHMLPESRKEQGLLLQQTIRHNVSAPHLDRLTWPGGLIKTRQERARVRSTIEALDIRPAEPDKTVSLLSGGNQQKVLFAKWLFEAPSVFLIDEPTRGVDVGAKQAIYALIAEQAKRGIAVVMVSSEIEEILGLAHRVLVMRQGALIAEFDEADEPLDEGKIVRAAFGADRVPGSMPPPVNHDAPSPTNGPRDDR